MARKAAKNQLVSFSKRRKALIRKASELCRKCEAEVAVLVVSQSGNTFSFGHSSVDHLLTRYANQSQSQSSAAASPSWKTKATELQALKARLRSQGRDDLGNCDSVGELEKTKAKYLSLLHKVQRKLKNDASLVNCDSLSPPSVGSAIEEENNSTDSGKGNDIWKDICLDDTNFQLDDHQNYMSFWYGGPSQQLNDIDIADYGIQFTSY